MTSYSLPTHQPRMIQLGIDIVVVTDSRTTVCSVRQSNDKVTQLLGQGVSMRRRRDPRDEHLGVNLALVRALEEVLLNLRKELVASGHGDLSGLPQKQVHAMENEIKKIHQEHHRLTQEFLAAATGHITPADIGLSGGEDG